MKNILILGNARTKSTKMIVEAGEKKGHTMTVISPEHFICEVSEYEAGYDKIHYYNTKTNSYQRIYKHTFHAVINRVAGNNFEMAMYVIKQFENLGIFVTNSSQSCKNCTDKFLTHQILSKAKLPNPKSILCPNVIDFKYIGNRIGIPFIAKKRAGSSQGKGVFKIDSIDSANQFLGMVDEKLLLQKYIDSSENGYSSDIRAIVIGDAYTNYEVVASYKRISKKGEWKANYSISKTGEKVTLTSNEKNAVIQASKAVGTGINGVDLMRYKDAGGIERMTIIETNSNAGLTGVTSITGVDVARKIIEYVENRLAKRINMAGVRATNEYVSSYKYHCLDPNADYSDVIYDPVPNYLEQQNAGYNH